jgi:hypothetical protein
MCQIRDRFVERRMSVGPSTNFYGSEVIPIRIMKKL